MLNHKDPACQQAGFVSGLLIILAALSIIVYLVISSTFPFKDKMFALLYPKPPSHAAESTQSVGTNTDVQPPSVPADLSARAVSASQVNLSWSQSSDNVAVTGYEIYKDGAKLATVATTSYGETGLADSTSFSYFVKAVDGAGNISLPSNTISVSTLALLASTVNITGIVYSSGDILSGVKVSITVNGTNKTYLTNSEGAFNINNIPAGTYVLSFKKTGYLNQEIKVDSTLSKETVLRIDLIQNK